METSPPQSAVRGDHDIPITTPERTLIDLAPALPDRTLARAVREAIRLKTTTPSALLIALARHRGRPEPVLNAQFEAQEADLTWPNHQCIVELDGPQFHLDATEDLRKQRIWEAAGWSVRRLPTDDIYLHPDRLLAVCP